MTFCTNCGQPLSGQPVCINCGQPVAGPPQPGSAGNNLDPAATTFLPTAPPTGPPMAPPPGPPPWNVGPAASMGTEPFDPPPVVGSPLRTGRSRRRSALLLAAAVVVVVIAAVSVVIVMLHRKNQPDHADPINVVTTSERVSSTSSAEFGSTVIQSGGPSLSVVSTTIPGEGGAIPGSSTTGSTGPDTTPAPTSVLPTIASGTTPASITKPSSPAPTALADPMAGPARPLACGSGYIVQIASAATASGLHSHVAALVKSHLLPTTAWWTDIAGSCQIWTAKSGAVLYAGPFLSPSDGCDARLHSPSDSFIKIVDADNYTNFYSCMCPPNAAPPTLGTGSKGPWVGEAQRALSKHGYAIPGLQGETGVPVAWGIYNDDTVAAVKHFQTDHALPPTGSLDAASWQSMSAAFC